MRETKLLSEITTDLAPIGLLFLIMVLPSDGLKIAWTGPSY